MNLDIRAINRCVRCGTCRSVCPVLLESGWESANARGRILVMKGLTDGLQADGDVLDCLNTCTTCGLCTENCPASVNPPDLIESARRQLVSGGIATPAQEALARNIFESGNALGDFGDRTAWLQDRSLLKEKAESVYFAGCVDSYRYPQTAARTFSLLSRFGATLLTSEQCCGSPLLRTGFDPRRFVDENLRQIRVIGAKTIITGCAGCYTTLKKSYLENSCGESFRDLQVLSVPEFLAEHIQELDLRPLDLTVTYHDPCHLGRANQIYDQPRRVIEAVCDLSEMKERREKARCCGGGGGVRSGYKDLSLKMARRRLEDVPEGVDYIVTACPLCVRNLRDAGAGEKAIDLADLVAMALR
jgi:Fe-S oxidoreductase